MKNQQTDLRSEQRKLLDEQIAVEPPLAPPDLGVDANPLPVENHLQKFRKHPVAVMGIVENGLVRPLDAGVKLAERSRVIIVASE